MVFAQAAAEALRFDGPPGVLVAKRPPRHCAIQSPAPGAEAWTRAGGLATGGLEISSLIEGLLGTSDAGISTGRSDVADFISASMTRTSARPSRPEGCGCLFLSMQSEK